MVHRFKYWSDRKDAEEQEAARVRLSLRGFIYLLLILLTYLLGAFGGQTCGQNGETS